VAKDKLREALSTLESSTFVSSDELGPLRAAVTAVEETHATVVAETLDDAGILDALVRARTKAQRVAVSQRQLIVAILGFEDLPITVDDFVLRTPTRATAQAPEAPEAPAEPQPEAETQEPEPVLPS
jgi:hypothetical protein